MIKYLKYGVPGSTLIEVIVAMIIISITFSLSLGILTNTFNNNKLSKQYYYHLVGESFITQSICENDYESKIIEIDKGVFLDKKVDYYQNHPKLYLIKVVVSKRNGEVITNINKIAKVDEN